MKREFQPERLPVAEFAQASGHLAGTLALSRFPRLAAEAVESIEGHEVRWEADGEEHQGSGGRAETSLHLRAGTTLPLACQRCLTPVLVPIEVDRWFRFAADEGSAAALDEELEEDVLVASRDFDLLELIEDELLMELPITPRHEVCPQAVPLSVQDADFDAAGEKQANPFAALAKLRSGKPE